MDTLKNIKNKIVGAVNNKSTGTNKSVGAVNNKSTGTNKSVEQKSEKNVNNSNKDAIAFQSFNP
jgi:hypothetical protein